jgi:hypothetical protein
MLAAAPVPGQPIRAGATGVGDRRADTAVVVRGHVPVFEEPAKPAPDQTA